MRSSRDPAWLLLALLIATASGAWAARVVHFQRWMSAAEEDVRRGDRAAAIGHAGAALAERCPVGCDAARARAMLETVASEAEGRGDDATALAAWSAIRSGVRATSADASWAEHADTEYARLAHRRTLTDPRATAIAEGAASELRLRGSLAEGRGPSSFTWLLVAAGVVGLAEVSRRVIVARDAGRRSRMLEAALALAAFGVIALGLLVF